MKIIFIGRLEKDIGVKVYKDALIKLKNTVVSFEFEAYGEGRLKQEFAKIGKIHEPTSDIYSVIRKADIVFASSYLAMLEALVQSKIVIAVYENSLKEEYLKNSPFVNYILICKNAEEIVSVVESLGKNSLKYKAMIEDGSAWAKSQTWDKVMNTYIKLWRI